MNYEYTEDYDPETTLILDTIMTYLLREELRGYDKNQMVDNLVKIITKELKV